MKPRPPLPTGPYLIVGLARSGIAAGLALRARGEMVIGVDAAAPAGAQALAEAGVELHLDEDAASGNGAHVAGAGEDGVALLDRARAVVKSPGVPAQAPVIAHARARGLPVLGELELGWRLLPNEMIAVTGTNGKTTTVELIGHIHRAAGLPVAVAGNVGTALSGLVGTVDPSATIVCEVSSFQLEDTIDFAPEAAVLLNITADHLDRHGTFENYRDAKLQIFAHQTAHDLAVRPLSFDVALPGGAREVGFGEIADPYGGPRSASVTLDRRAPAEGAGAGVEDAGAASDGAGVEADCGRTICWQGRSFLDVSELRLRGRHNIQNAMAAAAVCLARGVTREAVREGLRTFTGVAHRLEEIASRNGVLYVNDSKATNVASTLVALDAFPGAGLHLILGGQGKGQDFSALREPVAASCRAVYLIGEDADAIAAALDGAGVPVRACGTLERALAEAAAAATQGDVVLLSPACASFDQFADFEARGERFRALVMALR